MKRGNMLEIDLVGRTADQFRRLKKPKVLAVYSFRYDAHLVPAMKANLDGAVDGFVSFDDTQSAELFSSEPARRTALLKTAVETGADWILAVDPDERFEPALHERIEDMVSGDRAKIWQFHVRELYETDAYRSDGLWDKKTVDRLFSTDYALADERALHAPWPGPATTGVRAGVRTASGLNLYHLKMLTPERRAARRNLYADLDPARKFNDAGYDYLDEEHGLELTKIPKDRMYHPPHQEDGALWMGQAKGEVPDPPELRFARAMLAVRNGNRDAARHVFEKSVHKSDNQEFTLKMSRWALQFGFGKAAADGFDMARGNRPIKELPTDMLELGLGIASHSSNAALFETCLRCLADRAGDDAKAWIAQHRYAPVLDNAVSSDAFMACGWAKAPVTILWGRDAPYDARLATVVIGLHCPEELKHAVASLLAQSTETLIIVVNSGHGDLAEMFAANAARLILVQTPERVMVGAARNIGASLARSAHVAFLAEDCIAEENWIENRLRHHDAGHSAVASLVANPCPDSAIAWAYHLILFQHRLPDTPEERAILFGVSYSRALIDSVGWFDPDLRTREDDQFNASCRQITPIGFASDVVTAHWPKTQLFAAMLDMIGRGKRLAYSRPVLEKIFIRRFNYKLPGAIFRALFLRPFNETRKVHSTRSGLPDPDNRKAFRRGMKLTLLLYICRSIGMVSQLPHEFAARKKAYRLSQQMAGEKIKHPDDTLDSLFSRGYLSKTVLHKLKASRRKTRTSRYRSRSTLR